MIYRTFRRLVALFVIILFSACGGDYRHGSYTVGFDPAWFGLDLMGQQNNVTGFSKDLLKEIGKMEKTKLAMVPVSWDVLMPNLKSGQYNAIFSSIYPYIFNQTYFDFSDPYLLTGPVLVVRFASKVTSIDQLSGKEVATLPDSTGTLYLEKNPTILIRNYDSIPDALNAIVAGTIDAAIIDVLAANAYCRNIYHGKLKVATLPLNQNGLRLLTSSGADQELVKIFNRGLIELKKNGTYETLLKKWSLDH